MRTTWKMHSGYVSNKDRIRALSYCGLSSRCLYPLCSRLPVQCGGAIGGSGVYIRYISSTLQQQLLQANQGQTLTEYISDSQCTSTRTRTINEMKWVTGRGILPVSIVYILHVLYAIRYTMRNDSVPSSTDESSKTTRHSIFNDRQCHLTMSCSCCWLGSRSDSASKAVSPVVSSTLLISSPILLLSPAAAAAVADALIVSYSGYNDMKRNYRCE
jgi:hypothetical protein